MPWYVRVECVNLDDMYDMLLTNKETSTMEQLNYAALKKVDYKGFVLEKAPEKVLQFGEGNFLRAFVN